MNSTLDQLRSSADFAPQRPRGPRIAELDGLRGLAILLVLIWHYGHDANSDGGYLWVSRLMDSTSLFWSGVDLFFVLSGFLIGGILIDQRESPNYFKTFYARRIFRIIPIYVVVVGTYYLAVSVGLPNRVHGIGNLFGSGIPWYAYFTLTQNVFYALGKPALPTWLGVTWSLAIEEQFYLVLPAAMWLIPRRWLPYFTGAGIVCAAVLRLFLNRFYSSGNLASFYLMPCRADALLLGVAAALIVRHAPLWQMLNRQRGRLAGAWIVLFSVLPYFVLFDQSHPIGSPWMSSFGFTLLALFYTGLLLLVLLYSDGLFGRMARASWLRSLGTISYGVYLIHFGVLWLTFAVFAHKSPWAITPAEHGLVLLALVVTLTLAYLSSTFFERPLIKIGHDFKY